MKERKWLPSRGMGWATRLTRAQKRFATQRAAGVAREGSLSQLVPVDTFFPLSSILTFVFQKHWALPLLGTEVGLRMLCASGLASSQRDLEPGAP